MVPCRPRSPLSTCIQFIGWLHSLFDIPIELWSDSHIYVIWLHYLHWCWLDRGRLRFKMVKHWKSLFWWVLWPNWPWCSYWCTSISLGCWITDGTIFAHGNIFDIDNLMSTMCWMLRDCQQCLRLERCFQHAWFNRIIKTIAIDASEWRAEGRKI